MCLGTCNEKRTRRGAVVQDHLAEAMLSRTGRGSVDFIRSTAVGSLAELTTVLGELMEPWVSRLAALATTEIEADTPQNRHHGAYLLGVLVRVHAAVFVCHPCQCTMRPFCTKCLLHPTS
jgi:hypothetical protein